MVLLFAVIPSLVTGCALATKAPPVAYAGPDVTVRVGEKVTLDASQSADLDGGPIVYYQWKITVAPKGRDDQIGRVIQEGADAMIWTTPQAAEEQDVGEWVIEVKVTDDEGQSATDDITLTVEH
jgi:hypothetical protein